MTYKIAVLEKIDDSGVLELEQYFDVDHLIGLNRQELLTKIAPYDIIIAKSNIQVDETFLNAAKNLKVIGRAGVGTDNFDLDAISERQIQFFTTPTGNTISTAEFTIGMILNLIRRVPEIQAAVTQNDFRRHLYEGRELSQMTVGIFGVGNTGMAVAKRLSAFGCKLLCCDRTMRRKTIFEDLGGEMVEKIEDMLPRLDILTLHVPSTSETHHVINNDVFNAIKKGAYLINTARGNIVNEVDLLNALNDGRLSGAALDLLDPEPSYDAAPQFNVYKNDLVSHPKVIYTPHIAASTQDAQNRISRQLAQKIKDALL